MKNVILKNVILKNRILKNIIFEKYHNLGNDFIIIDDRKKEFHFNKSFIKKLCCRNFGIGADGIIFLQKEKIYFRMKIYNSDGSIAISCGNALLSLSKYINRKTRKSKFFIKTEKDLILATYDVKNGKSSIAVSLPKIIEERIILIDKKEVKGFFVFSGVFHFVVLKKRIPKNISIIGKKIREHEAFSPNGTNVCFVEEIVRKDKKNIFLRVYEKGVENETYACGTGAIASSYVLKEKKVKVNFLYGSMDVFFDEKAHLSSYPEFVYKGSFPL